MSKDQFDLDAALDDAGTPAGLRKWAENVQATNKKLTDELATFKQSQRKNAVTGALKTLGASEKVATFYPADAEASDDAVAKWFAEFKDVFGVPAASNDSGETAPSPADHSPVATDLVAAMRMIQDSTPTSGSTTTLADRAAEIDRLPMKTADDRSKLDAFEHELMDMARQASQQHFGSMQR